MADLFPVIARPTVPPPLVETPSELLNPHYKIYIIKLNDDLKSNTTVHISQLKCEF